MAKRASRTPKDTDLIPCTLMELPQVEQVEAAEVAKAINPANAPKIEAVLSMFATAIAAGVVTEEEILAPSFLAALTSKYWGAEGVKLTVGFLDSPSAELRNKFLQYLNLWSAKGANVQFVYSQTDPQVRITRGQSGYWSYLGTDILRINRNQPTMCFQGFTLNTPDSEWMRVVPHEGGHTLAFPHEHLREDIIARLDVNKTLAYFRQTQGWSDATTRANVLTPLRPGDITATPTADETSIMAYSLPAQITRDGRAIVGGARINDRDYEFVNVLYPGKVEPPPPPAGRTKVIIEFDGPVPTPKSVTVG